MISIEAPPRSMLLRPEPKGLGTGNCQSLRSYLIDLAELHCVSPGEMIYECCPEYRAKKGQHVNRKSICLPWVYSRRIINRFSELTKRDDLDLLTMLPWEDLISVMRLTSYHQKWCPLCLQDSDHEQLLWTLHDVTACTVHEVELEQLCYRCGESLKAVNLSPTWLRCACGCLRKEGRSRPADPTAIWKARQISKVIEKGYERPLLSESRILEVWEKIVVPCLGNGTKGARFLGIHPCTAYTLRYGHRSMRLAKLLAISSGLGVELVDLLTAKISDLRVNPVPAKGERMERSYLSAAELEKKVGELAEAIPLGTITKRGFAAKLGVSTERLLRKFPDLAEKVANAFQARQRKEREKRNAQTIRRMVNIIRANGSQISEKAIGRAIGLKVFPHVQRLIKKARELAASCQMELPLSDDTSGAIPADSGVEQSVVNGTGALGN